MGTRVSLVAMDLVGGTEIAQMLGVSRQRALQLAGRDDFPRPVATLSVGRIWRRQDVTRWALANGRLTDATPGP